MPAKRRAINAFLSDDAYDGWHGFALRNGCTVSALLEVMGERLGAARKDANPLALTDLVEKARRLDHARRRRTGDS